MNKKLILLSLLFLFLSAGCRHIEYTPETVTTPKAVPMVNHSDTSENSQEQTETKEEDASTNAMEISLTLLESFRQVGYTKENPLTDSESIIHLLTALEELQYSNFNKVGWYHMTCRENEISWIHFSEPETRIFDQSLWLRDYPFYKKINVAAILLNDGTFGGTVFTDNSMSDYKFHSLPLPNKNLPGWEDSVRPEESHLKNMSWFVVSMPFGNFEVLKRRLNGENGVSNVLYPEKEHSRFEYKVWMEIYEGNEVIAIQERRDDILPCRYDGGGVYKYSIDTEFYSLKDGRKLYDYSEGLYTDGGIIGPFEDFQLCPGSITHYDQLPADIQAIYEEAEGRLRKFIADGGNE